MLSVSVIAVTHSEKQSLRKVFPEQCLKATSDPEFLSCLYGFDMSLCPHQVITTYYVTDVFKEKFDAINSTCRVPALLIWMKSQVCLTIIVLFILNDFHCAFVETS